MSLNVSLPKELENLVHQQVKTGMYQSASEVVREALRNHFLGAVSEAEVMAHASRQVEKAKRRGKHKPAGGLAEIDRDIEQALAADG